MAESREETTCDQPDSESIITRVKRFLDNGCGCSRGYKGGLCSQQLLVEDVVSNLNNCLELTHAELDLVVLANIQVFTSRFRTWREKKEKSSMQLPLPFKTYLQGNVFKPVRNKLLSVS